ADFLPFFIAPIPVTSTTSRTIAKGIELGDGSLGDDEGGEEEETDNPPEIWITTPSTGSERTAGAEIVFAAYATDVEDDDGTLTDSITWSTDYPEGISGTGASATISSTLD